MIYIVSSQDCAINLQASHLWLCSSSPEFLYHEKDLASDHTSLVFMKQWQVLQEKQITSNWSGWGYVKAHQSLNSQDDVVPVFCGDVCDSHIWFSYIRMMLVIETMIVLGQGERRVQVQIWQKRIACTYRKTHEPSSHCTNLTILYRHFATHIPDTLICSNVC